MRAAFTRIWRRPLIMATLVVLVLMPIIILLASLSDYARIVSGHAARISCSEHFVANRPVATVIANDLHARTVRDIPAFRLMRVTADDAQQTTQTSLLGLPLFRNTAVYRPGHGCTLLRGDVTIADLQATAPPATVYNLVDGADWPVGNVVAYPPNAALDAALEVVLFHNETGAPLGTRAVVVIKDGVIVGERYAAGFTADTPLQGWSMTKSVTGMLAGIAIDETPLELESQMLYSEWTDLREVISLADLLSMSDGLGFENDTSGVSDETLQLYTTDDMVAYAREQPAEAAPNTTFNYNNGAPTLVIGAIRQQVTDETEWLNYPYAKLFGPLGMRSAVMELDASDNFVGASQMYATARDWGRLGLLMLQDGVWQGEVVLPAGWASYMASPNSTTIGGWYGKGFIWRGVPEWDMGFDLPEDAYWFTGFDGQFVIIIPSENVVIVRLGFTPDEDFLLRPALMAEILAALP